MATVRKRSWTTAKGEPRAAWTVDLVDSSGNRERRQFTSKAAANAFRIMLEGQLQKGTYRPDASRVTVGDVADAFLAYCEARMTRGEPMTRQTTRPTKATSTITSARIQSARTPNTTGICGGSKAAWGS